MIDFEATLNSHMDDSLEQPNADFSKTLISETGESLRKEDDEGQSSDDDEEGGLDWTKLPQVLLVLLHQF